MLEPTAAHTIIPRRKGRCSLFYFGRRDPAEVGEAVRAPSLRKEPAINRLGTLAAFLKNLGSPFSQFSRSVITFALVFYLAAGTYLTSAISAPPHIDERAWVDRSLKPLWSDEPYPYMYYYARHHPSFARIVYASVLHLMGVYECDKPLVDYESNKGWEWNLLRGAYVPLEIQQPLRLVNFAFLCGMLAFVYFGFKRAFKNRIAAVAGCLPVIFCHPIYTGPSPYIGVAPYIGTDSMLLFWLAAFWYVWMWARDGGFARVFITAIVGGLLISTKFNGAFALAGAAVYFAVSSRGIRRVLYPIVLLAVPFAIFVALNPVYRPGNLAWTARLAWMAKALGDTAALMFKLKGLTAEQEWGQFTRTEVIEFAFPYWLFYLAATAIILYARREKWWGPTVAWALPTVLLNWLLIYVPFPRYAAPIAMAFLVLLTMAAMRLILDELASLGIAGAGTEQEQPQ